VRKNIYCVLICLSFLGCFSKNEQQITPELSQDNHIEKSTQAGNGNFEKTPIAEKPILEKYELDESVFNEFPDMPEYFFRNNIPVTIEEDDKSRLGYTIYVKGENFSILYIKNDNHYSINRVALYGDTIFARWNIFFGEKDENIIKTWGEPKRFNEEYIYYTTDIISVRFFVVDYKVNRIQIYYEP
jgi:hypothetical protein